MKEKIKDFVKSAEMKCAGVASVAAMTLTGLASAEEPAGSTSSSTVISAFQTGFQSMANDALGMIATIVPIALGVAGVVYLSRKALGWFKSLAK
mgnify:CR=1 FL=1